jgi:Homeodomain-like domain
LPAAPAAHYEGERLQARRLRAAELFALGLRQAEVARQLGVSSQAVSIWHARWRQGGTDALRSRGPTGPAPKVSEVQLGQIEQALPVAGMCCWSTSPRRPARSAAGSTKPATATCPSEPGVRDGRNALVRWAVLLEEVLP